MITNDAGNIEYHADRKGDLYFVRKNAEVCKNVCVDNVYSDLLLWHRRLGHLNFKDFRLLTFRLPGFEPLNGLLKVAKLLSCITYQLYTKFMSEVEPIYRLFGSLKVKQSRIHHRKYA